MNDKPEDPPAVPAVLIYAKPADAKVPHAAWFGTTVKATAMLGAKRQDYTALEFAEPYIDLVKAAVPQGELSPAGKVTLPGVKRDVLERLLANLAGAPVESPDGSGKLPPGTVPIFVGSSDDIPTQAVPVDPLWAGLAVNMVVLTADFDSQGIPQGWWEALIVTIEGEVFTLRFRDYPRQPLVHRKRDEIAIMYPPPVRV
jgi:hypothetical protein